MNNYFINASIYNYSLGNSPNIKEIYNYYKNINFLEELIDKEPRNLRYYFFYKDIHYLEKSVKNLEKIKYTLGECNDEEGIKIIKSMIENIKISIDEIFKILTSKITRNDRKDISDYIIFEKWFDIKDVTILKQDNLKISENIEFNQTKLKQTTIKNINVK